MSRRSVREEYNRLIEEGNRSLSKKNYEDAYQHFYDSSNCYGADTQEYKSASRLLGRCCRKLFENTGNIEYLDESEIHYSHSGMSEEEVKSKLVKYQRAIEQKEEEQKKKKSDKIRNVQNIQHDGFWIRSIDPEKELRKLRSDENDRESAFHYVIKGIPQILFSSIGEGRRCPIGVLVKPDNRTVLFRDSNEEIITDDIIKSDHSSETKMKLLTEHNIHPTHENEISGKVKNLFINFINSNYHSHDDIDNARLRRWTEGLFHYTKDDISHICVNPDNTESCYEGYKFAKALEGKDNKIGFCQYNKEDGGVYKVERDLVRRGYFSHREQDKKGVHSR